MTINTPNRALIEQHASAALGPFGFYRLTANELNALLDAARAEGPVQEKPRDELPAEYRGVFGKATSDVGVAGVELPMPKYRYQAEDNSGGPALVTPPADEVGRAVERLTKDCGLDYIGYTRSFHEHASDVRLILSHVSRLEGERAAALKTSCEHAQDRTIQFIRAQAADRGLRLAVEALEPFAKVWDEQVRDLAGSVPSQGLAARPAWGFNGAVVMWGDFQRAAQVRSPDDKGSLRAQEPSTPGGDVEASSQTEIADLKQSVIAFCAPWAVTYARDFGLPKDHLHPVHYDILAKCGARMDAFTRASLPTPLMDTSGQSGGEG